MKNRILSLTRDSIPYVKELRPLAKSMAGCVVMQQLDYWFEKYPHGFFKFLEPTGKSRDYKRGKSWSEELNCSAEEFVTAFDKIGVRYKSKTEYESTPGDKFKGRFYCSYFDRSKGLTYYFRNHELVDSKLDELISRETESVGLRETDTLGLRETGKAGLQKPTPPVSGNRRSRSLETDNVGLLIDQEITEETKEENTHTDARVAPLPAAAAAEAESVCVSGAWAEAETGAAGRHGAEAPLFAVVTPEPGVDSETPPAEPETTGGDDTTAGGRADGIEGRPLSVVTHPAAGNGDSRGRATGGVSPQTHPTPAALAERLPPVAGTRYLRAQLKAYGQAHPRSITDLPKWLNSKRTHRGDFDESIAEWYEQGCPVEGSEASVPAAAAAAPGRDTSVCPDCQGKQWWYPDGPGKGVAKCRHPRLGEPPASDNDGGPVAQTVTSSA